jgi:Ca2+-binding EF-hand superfamily protein
METAMTTLPRVTGALGASVFVVAAAVAGLAAQNRGFDRPRPQSRLVTALDTNQDGTISSAEIKAATATLAKLDTNGDGKLSAEELRPAFGPGGGRGFGGEGRGRGGEGGPGGTPAMSADDLADTLMAFDRNGDGTLTRTEIPERFQGLFDRADTNKDGVLTKEELKQSATASVQEAERGGRGGERGGRGGEAGRRGGPIDPLMQALDKDSDGTLSAAELADAPKALLRLDKNGDGQLTADEYRMAMPPGPGRGGEERR